MDTNQTDSAAEGSTEEVNEEKGMMETSDMDTNQVSCRMAKSARL